MDVVVVGNVTLDVICYPVEDVPRFDSISFESSAISPGGCGSNVAIGLAARGVNVSLVAHLGNDDAAQLVKSYWNRWGINLDHLSIRENKTTALSVGLVDRQFQPRFIHTPGANSTLSVDDIDPNAFKREGAKILLVAGFFVLPGLLDHRLGGVMLNLQNLGIKTVLDVVHSPRMDYPEYLWPVLPRLDIFLCNATEAMRITGKKNYEEAAEELHWRGAQAVVVKLGAKGCYLVDDVDRIYIEGVPVENVVDTTGAGDAFAAGLISALIEGRDMPEACVAGNQAGAKIVTEMGAITAWGKPDFGL